MAVCLVVSLFVYSLGWLFLCFGSFGPHFSVLVALCGSFWCLFCTLGDLGAPFGHPWTRFEHRLGTLGLHLGTLGVHVRGFVALWGGPLDTFSHFWEKGLKKVPQMIQNGGPDGSIFGDMWSFSRKLQTVFGPSRLQRIGVHATCCRPLSVTFEANGDKRLPGYSQMDARRPRRLISWIFNDFHRLSFILGGFRASWARRWAEFGAACGALWQISATPLR